MSAQRVGSAVQTAIVFAAHVGLTGGLLRTWTNTWKRDALVLAVVDNSPSPEHKAFRDALADYLDTKKRQLQTIAALTGSLYFFFLSCPLAH